MKKSFYNVSALALFGLSAAMSLAACKGDPDPAPKMIVSSNESTPNVQGTVPYAFGNVALTQSANHTFFITNTGDLAGDLHQVTSTGVLLGNPFSLIAGEAPAEGETPAGTPVCYTGITLAPGATCTVEVKFAPLDSGSFSDALEVSYSKGPYLVNGQPSTANLSPKTATLGVNGKGVLDCSIDPTLVEARGNGVDAANAQMEADRARGKADGDALTKSDGETDGYNDGYSSGYNQGYNSPQGYDKGYNEGYSSGYTRGLSDTASCNRGNTDGYNDGFADGRYRGYNDGFDDGYDDGYVTGNNSGYGDGYDDGYVDGKVYGYNSGASKATNDGLSDGYADGYDIWYPSGYEDGYWDGSSSCSFSDPANGSDQALDVPNPEKYTDACYDQGYDATYKSGEYKKAYDKAKAENANYQAGYQTGKASGVSAGIAKGTQDGYNAGKSAGDRAGFAAGSDIRYANCYNSRYPVGVTDGYNAYYDAGYDDGWDDGLSDGYAYSYNRGYDVGYDDGYDDGYDPGYTANYNAAYNSGAANGKADGYAIGYDDGYYDGQYDNCGSFVPVQTASSLELMRKRDRTADKAQRPDGYVAAAKLPRKVKESLEPTNHKIRERGVAAPRLSTVLTTGDEPLTEEQLAELAGISSKDDASSLRNFHRSAMARKHTGGRNLKAVNSTPKDKTSALWKKLEARKAERLKTKLLKNKEQQQ